MFGPFVHVVFSTQFVSQHLSLNSTSLTILSTTPPTSSPHHSQLFPLSQWFDCFVSPHCCNSATHYQRKSELSSSNTPVDTYPADVGWCAQRCAQLKGGERNAKGLNPGRSSAMIRVKGGCLIGFLSSVATLGSSPLIAQWMLLLQFA